MKINRLVEGCSQSVRSIHPQCLIASARRDLTDSGFTVLSVLSIPDNTNHPKLFHLPTNLCNDRRLEVSLSDGLGVVSLEGLRTMQVVSHIKL